MRYLYEKVDTILDRVDFDSIWPGFHRFDFALYNDESVFLRDTVIAHDNRFVGNTGIEYNGGYLAIWHVDNLDSQDHETLAADLVHEMFHAYQIENKESRFPNDLILLDYPDSEENYIVKHSENVLLAKAFLSKDRKEKKILLQQFISSRKYREGLIGDIIKQEYLSETIEGMADYAGCMALKQISESKFDKRICDYAENLQTPDGRFFDIRRMLYYSGAVFCVVLSETGNDFYHTIGNTELPLFFVVAGEMAEGRRCDSVNDDIIVSELEKYKSEKRLRFDKFYSAPVEKHQGDWVICGYDPMNMIKRGNEILCSHFIMLKSDKDNEPVFIQGPLVVRLKDETTNEVQLYIK